MILVVVALGLTASAHNRKTVARHIAEGTMPRSKRLQQQVVAVAAKSGIVPPWSVDGASTDDPPGDAADD
jgi:hypothetical protein